MPLESRGGFQTLPSSRTREGRRALPAPPGVSRPLGMRVGWTQAPALPARPPARRCALAALVHAGACRGERDGGRGRGAALAPSRTRTATTTGRSRPSGGARASRSPARRCARCAAARGSELCQTAPQPARPLPAARQPAPQRPGRCASSAWRWPTMPKATSPRRVSRATSTTATRAARASGSA